MLLGIALLGFALITYFKPTFGLGLILALLPTYLIRYQFGSIPTTFLELILIIFLILVLSQNIARFSELKKLGIINWLILAFVIAGIISVVVSPDQKSALGVFKAFIVEPILFFYAVKLLLRKKEDLTTPLNLLFLGAIVVSLFGILQYPTFIHLPLRFWGTGSEVERIVSVFDYPNALSLYLAPLVGFFLAGFLFDDNTLNRRNLALGLIFMIAALILTFSRGAWIALGVTSFVLLAIKYPLKKVLPVTLVLIALVVVIPSTRQRLNLINHDSSSSAHVDLFSQAVTKIKASPILGNGLSGFRDTLIKQNYQGEILNYPHNIFLNFWLETGLLGLVSIFAVIFVSIRRYKINRSWYTIGAISFLSVMIIHGLVDVPYFKNDLSILFWFVISIFYI